MDDGRACISSLYGQLSSFTLLKESALHAGVSSPSTVASVVSKKLQAREWELRENTQREIEGRLLNMLGPQERTVAVAIDTVLKRVLDPYFPNTVVGWRRHFGLRALGEWWPDGTVYEFDVRWFFPSVRTNLLMIRLGAYLKDRSFLKVIRDFLIFCTKSSVSGAQGLPLGVSFSPVLANFYLLPVDQKLAPEYDCCRYSDNWYFVDREGGEMLDSLLATIGLEVGRKRTWEERPPWLI